ncbi:hypothetical protein Bca52824_022546 [Brassica carinata]|uniref:Uncharacterized protein n=1 Tax=Brassica carinata TaxID=52824 RepID=A0A8X8ARG9_BRACI|nr:hypothetical protein Bca52824_022546 [Brassica carinata]
MTNYMLQDVEKHLFKNTTDSTLLSLSSSGGSGWPQSTLWSPFASGNSSPVGSSREPTPPLTPVTVETKPVMIPSQTKQALIDDQIRSIQANVSSSTNDNVIGHKARNYQHQQRPRSGVKAVFVDGSGSRTGSGGTGVFLPRCHGTVVESRKKSAKLVVLEGFITCDIKVYFDFDQKKKRFILIDSYFSRGFQGREGPPNGRKEGRNSRREKPVLSVSFIILRAPRHVAARNWSAF